MLVWLLLLNFFASVVVAQLPPGFVSISDVDPTILLDIRYHTNHNFVGSSIVGYDAGKCILTTQAAQAFASAQKIFMSMKPQPFSLKMYDCYRPQMAVDEFVLWSQNPDLLMKQEFYPNLNKSELFPQGYIAVNSSHCHGSTADLTIVPFPPPKEEKYHRGMPLFPCTNQAGKRFLDNSIDMGTGFDCFDPLANTANPNITQVQAQNRAILNQTLASVGFVNYAGEWWHFTLQPEPFPHTAFNFPIR